MQALAIDATILSLSLSLSLSRIWYGVVSVSLWCQCQRGVRGKNGRAEKRRAGKDMTVVKLSH